MADQTITASGTVPGPYGDVAISTTSHVPEYSTDGDKVTYDHEVSIGGQGSAKINLALVIDRSGSTTGNSGSNIDGNTGTGSFSGGRESFLEAEQYAAKQLFQKYIDLGYRPEDVTITLVGYGSSAINYGTYTLDQQAAFNTAVNSISNTGSGTTATNFTAGLNMVNTAWNAAGIDPNGTNTVVFLSDGEANSNNSGIAGARNTLVNNWGAKINAIGIGSQSNVGNVNNPNDSHLDTVDNTAGAEKITNLDGLMDLISAPPPLTDMTDIVVKIEYEDVNGVMQTVTKTYPKGDPAIQPTPTGYKLVPQELDLDPNAKLGTDIKMQFTTNFNNGADSIVSALVIVPSYVCFAGTAMILTDRGEVRASELHAGDMVLTRDHGFQPIRWIGKRRVPAAMLGPNSKVRPVRIKAGALGPHNPQRDLLVSPQHRLVIASEIAQRMFGASEVLVAAKHLVGYPGIAIADDLDSVDYVHFAFDQHQLVFADGALSESLFAGPQALAMMTPDQREELLTIFPEWADPLLQITAARPIPKGAQARTLVARHSANRKVLVSARLH